MNFYFLFVHCSFVKLFVNASSPFTTIITLSFTSSMLTCNTSILTGNIEAFNKIKEAYNYLINLQTYEDEIENTVPLQYEVTIRKKAGKVGLGMTVTEDKIHQRLLVGKVNSEIDIVNISEESGGSIHSGDRLIGIDSDDCSLWITNRLLARLGPVRIPANGTVVFTLERRVAPDDDCSDSGSDVYEQTVYSNTPTPSPVPTTIFERNGTSASGRTVHTNNTNTNIAVGSTKQFAPLGWQSL